MKFAKICAMALVVSIVDARSLQDIDEDEFIKNLPRAEWKDEPDVFEDDKDESSGIFLRMNDDGFVLEMKGSG